jgi:hypothetical protein
MGVSILMVIVLVMVITEKNTHRQVDWLQQCQQQSFRSLRVFY